MSTRQYELIVFGATGFTGTYVCEHVTTSLPTDLKWAIAGRSTSKLEQTARDLKKLNTDRQSPAIETCSLDLNDLRALARKTKVLITTVGPYHKYGTAVLEACAESGTHYLDVTGESPWVLEMIKKYDNVAKANKAIIIPQIGLDSAPADLLAWSMVTYARNTLNVGTADLIYSKHELKGAPSGGTLSTILSLFEKYTLGQVFASTKPFALSPIGPPANLNSVPGPSLATRLLGVRTVRDLGVLTTNIQGPTDASQVYRTWGLLDQGKLYGARFRFLPYTRVRNVFAGVLVHFAISFGFLSLLLPPVRMLLKRLVYQPGDGPSRELSKNYRVEYRAIANADTVDPSDPKRIYGKFVFEGSAYHVTGIFAAEAAMSLLRDKTLAGEIGGGILTPATLGSAYVERLQKAGVKIDVSMMP